ncbi:MAG: glycosyltransferase family 4 protein [Candidatus Moraniibacteriota bacterium]|nr:MAG: glycosyltransferase family 4 protein [Candidatus Moranbacteria bacterium]
MAKLHVLLVPSWYPTPTRPLSGIFFREQAIALKKAGFDVGVVAPILRSVRYGLTKDSIFSKEIWVDDCGVRTLSCELLAYPKLRRLNMMRWLGAGRRLFEVYIRRYGKPDIIHAHSILHAGVLAKIILKEYGIPYVITEHSSAFARGLINHWQSKLIKKSISSASCMIAVSKDFARLLQETYPSSKAGDWKYVPNLVDISKFKYENLDTNNGTSDEFVFFTAAFLTKKKGINYLIEAMAEKFRGGAVRLWIAGDGEERVALERLARERGIDNQIEFLGNLGRKEISRRMSLCDAFVLPSLYETFGVVLIEALASGKPVVATKCGGPESIVTPECGYLVSPADSNQLAEAMAMIMRDKNSFSAESIRRSCVDRFSEDAVVSELSNLYSKVLRE